MPDRNALVQNAAALLPALKEARRRREPAGVVYSVPVRSPDGVRLNCRMIEGNPRKAVVVAHPAVVGSRYVQVVGLAEELARTYSVFLFDFRGHGRSGGRCRLGFDGPALDLAAVVARVRALGFEKVGVAGFSMGAGAAFLAAAAGTRMDALVSIGCPPSFPEMAVWRDHPLAARSVMRLFGLRLDPRRDHGPAPVDVAAELDPFPKLMVFGEWEVAPQEDIDRFVDAVAPPVERMTVPDAWHADLKGRERHIREWFERAL
jgi:pimeloyl-ACP methyl ester carboxylesterase